MSSLYARANSRQQRILRIVEGACKNASHAHPQKQLDPRMMRSIAKRATGTLTAAWPDVLATPMELSVSVPRPASSPGAECEASSASAAHRASDSHFLNCPRPVRVAYWTIGALAGEARRAGDTVRHDALADALRILAKALAK